MEPAGVQFDVITVTATAGLIDFNDTRSFRQAIHDHHQRFEITVAGEAVATAAAAAVVINEAVRVY